jgi:hypothetical protein
MFFYGKQRINLAIRQAARSGASTTREVFFSNAERMSGAQIHAVCMEACTHNAARWGALQKFSKLRPSPSGRAKRLVRTRMYW